MLEKWFISEGGVGPCDGRRGEPKRRLVLQDRGIAYIAHRIGGEQLPTKGLGIHRPRSNRRPEHKDSAPEHPWARQRAGNARKPSGARARSRRRQHRALEAAAAHEARIITAPPME